MRKGVGVNAVCSIAVLIMQLYMPTVSAEPSQVTMSQVIRPLYCTVDITTDGLRLHVQLVPEICMRSPKARQLLADTKSSLGL